jgi:hypothetical protein
VNTAGRAAVSGVRKLCHSRKTSGTSDSHITSATGTPISSHFASKRRPIGGVNSCRVARRPTASLMFARDARVPLSCQRRSLRAAGA